MNEAALEGVFRTASARIIGALAARFRDLDTAEDAFSEACTRALRAWPADGAPADPAAWLYRVAARIAVDRLRQRRTRERLIPDEPPPEPTAEEAMMDDHHVIPDERLRLIFICCHPAVAPDARAALTLRLVVVSPSPKSPEPFSSPNRPSRSRWCARSTGSPTPAFRSSCPGPNCGPSAWKRSCPPWKSPTPRLTRMPPGAGRTPTSLPRCSASRSFWPSWSPTAPTRTRWRRRCAMRKRGGPLGWTMKG